MKPDLQLVSSNTGILDNYDWTELLEEMDLRDSLPILQQLGRRLKPAANHALAAVGTDEKATDSPAPTAPGSAAQG